MDPFFLWICVAVAIGAVATVRQVFFSARAKARRAIAKAVRKRIADVQDGEIAKICGILVYGSETLTAPITGRQCAAYSVVVRERDRDARNTATIDEADARSFRVEDESGVAWVQPTLVDLVVSMDRNLQTGFFEDPTPRMTAFLDAHGLEARGFLFNRVLEFSEGILEGGEAVAVLGVGAWEPDPDPTSSGRGGYRERAVRLRVTDPPDANMILSDDPATLG